MSRADNMLSILWLLKAGKQMTAQQLADELEIHVRTVYRCIDSLCASGVPIIAEAGHNGGYRIMDHFSKAPLLFRTDEQKALIHASIFAQDTGYPFTEALSRAIDKLKRYTNKEQLASLERYEEGLAVIHPPADERQKVFLQLLEEATTLGKAVEMRYLKERETTPVSRRLDPYGIVFWKGNWYTVGFCHLRQEIRSFRVDRIMDAEPSHHRFERPAHFSAKDFLLGQLLPGSDQASSLLKVCIHGEKQALDELCKHWLFGHTLMKRTASVAEFELNIESLLTYVPYFLLPYGKAIQIAEPQFLISRMVEVTTGMASYYQEMLAANSDLEAIGDQISRRKEDE
ncbi:YafY family protein [Brevibacillus sp. AY1]|uniref:helix-turn-helix transcriptional regulator n=1 Tax=Brevibacillus sp. AY1 TaxID=2807621 RepID=UPI002457DD54|nr:YafY family protein [Brevibacillus sp. AY1]MDH4619061.1 YafY family transcriptional regulator [Brevibacillus sp. AY1]